jgi:hypothetical protein
MCPVYRSMAGLKLAELRRVSFAPDNSAAAQAHIITHWVRERGLRASWPFEQMLRHWVQLAGESASCDAFTAMYRTRWAECDEEEAQVLFRKMMDQRSDGIPYLVPAWERYVPGSSSSMGHRRFDERDPEGPLGLLEYSVAQETNLTLRQRREALMRTFLADGQKPPFPGKYHYWGPAASEQRLLHIAASIAGKCENAARQTRDFSPAIRSWDKDLEYLRAECHAGWFAFEWPTVACAV